MSSDSWSKKIISLEQVQKNEDERIFLENKFPQLKDPNKCSHFSNYFEVMDIMRCFYTCRCNNSKIRQNILFISSDLTPYKRMTIKELFWHHNIFFVFDYDLKYDDIVINIDRNTLILLPNLIENIKLRHTAFPVNLYLFHKNLDPQELESILYEFVGLFFFYHMAGESFYTIHI